MNARIALLASFLITVRAGAAQVEWRQWPDDPFAQAKQQKRLVLLDLEAVWCHWCHVMDETTYRDPQVIALLNSGYIAVRVDQDSRPDLSNRYEDYGWPATVVFDSSGKEIVKRRGYIAPKEMIAMLRAINADPSPGPSVVPETKVQFPANAALSPRLRASLLKRYVDQYDVKNGGWGFDYKYLDADSVEYSMVLAQSRDAAAERRAKQTLEAQRKLLDPVWGGMYQYSTGGNWREPHFEKIMSVQADNIRVYALAYQHWRDPVYLQTASKLEDFLRTFLMSPDGAFYTSQDADVVAGRHSAEYFRLNDGARRKAGIPRVDTHIYSRENGWAIHSLAILYAATGEARYLSEATTAAKWISRNRSRGDGGFNHDKKDAAGPFLGDTLAMARAFLSLYEVTGERAWLSDAVSAGHFVSKTFGNTDGPGFVTSRTSTDAAYRPRPQRDENVALARFSNLLFQYSGKAEFRSMAESAMRYSAATDVAQRFPTAAVLLADKELATDPLHITIVAPKDDPSARPLFDAANAWPSEYKRLEWWDRREGDLPRGDVSYPQLKSAAAFVCTAGSCSSPILKPEAVREKIERLTMDTRK